MSTTESILSKLSDRINFNGQEKILTPPSIAKEMINILPEEVWNSHTKFLDPACKSGVFLHEIYLKLMETQSLIQEFPDKEERRHHILHNQLFGIALDPICQLTTVRTVYGTIKAENNIILIDNYLSIIKNKNHKFFKEEIVKEFGREMQFDVVIGNPPYQDSNGGGSRGIGGSTLYNKFIDIALELTNIVCMITKNNWFQSDTLESTRHKMITAGISEIINYPIIGEVFDGVDVSVSIFCIEKLKVSKTHYKKIEKGKVCSEYTEDIRDLGYIPDSINEIQIIRHVITKNSFSYHTFPNTPFGIRTNGKKSSSDDFVDESIVETSDYNIGLLCMDKSKIKFKYIKKHDIGKNVDILDNFKILCGQQLNKNKSVLTNIRGINPDQICTSSFGVVYCSKDKEEAYNAYKYINTRFFRFLVYCSIDTVSTISPSRFKLVPDQDFKPLDLQTCEDKDKIDWSQSIADIDQQLYKKYNLTDDEINYIESTIKPMQ